MRTRLAILIAAAGMILSTPRAWAHHAFQAEFDKGRPVHLVGTVTEMEWINPHSWIHIDVKNDDGTVVSWMVEAGSPNTLLRLGFSRNSLPPGTELVIDGYQAKDRSNRAVGKNITFPDGKKLFIGSTGTEGPPEETKK